MKKYLLTLSLLSLASVAFAADKNVRLGQLDYNSDPNHCNAPEIAGCGPCYKLCMDKNNSEGAKDVSRTSVSRAQKNGQSRAGRQ